MLVAGVLKDAEKSKNNANDDNDFKLMGVDILRQRLEEGGLDVDGSREMMIARLEENDRPKKRSKISD